MILGVAGLWLEQELRASLLPQAMVMEVESMTKAGKLEVREIHFVEFQRGLERPLASESESPALKKESGLPA